MKTGSKIIAESSEYTIYIGMGSHFTMEDGEIIGSTWGVDVNISYGNTFSMNGGRIIGATESDVRTSNNALHTISGKAEIGKVVLVTTVDSNSKITIAPSWIGSIAAVDLRGRGLGSDLPQIISVWENKPIINATNGYILHETDISKFTLRNFIASSSQSISDAYKL
jgi:hypothetical protein